MDKLKMHSPDLTQDNLARLKALFPNCVTESRDPQGKIFLAVDFDQLRQEFSDRLVEGPQERYHLDWPGKREALVVANAPIAKTLRPCREESVDFDTTKNLFIEGDNLDALNLLQETYLGKVKMIYIDPPYNTGNDFIYEDDFAESAEEFKKRSNQVDEQGNRLVSNTEANGRFHSDWLSMMYPRLKLARNLLREDGVIFVSIDDNEVARLRMLMDEIFGAENFIETIVWKRRYGGGAKEKHIVSIHEHILMYASQKTAVGEIFICLKPEQIERYYKLRDDRFPELGPHRLQPLEPAESMADRPNLRFAVVAPDGSEIWPERQWLWGRVRFQEAREKGLLHFSKKNGKWAVCRKQYLRDSDGEERLTKQNSIIDDAYGRLGSAEIEGLFDKPNVFSFPKPSKLIGILATLINDKDRNAVILDFFAGSASTAHAVMQLNAEDGGNRKFIMVQLPEICDEKSEAFKAGYKTIPEISKERIRRAGAKIKSELAASAPQPHFLENNPAAPAPSLDIGFRVLKVDTSNMEDVFYTPDRYEQDALGGYMNNVKLGRSHEDLLFQVLLDLGVDLTLPISKKLIHEKTVFFVDDNALAACFDSGINEELLKQLARFRSLDMPLRRVAFRDNGFVSDAAKINAEQIFKQLSPGTELRVI